MVTSRPTRGGAGDHACNPLPSEAEWEYAARASVQETARSLLRTPTNWESKLGKTTEVGAYPPNAWGLHDMHGNVWEGVEDVYHDSYQGAPIDGSAWTDGEGENFFRGSVIRGGSWGNFPGDLRSANHFRVGPDYRIYLLGFRVARTLD